MKNTRFKREIISNSTEFIFVLIQSIKLCEFFEYWQMIKIQLEVDR